VAASGSAQVNEGNSEGGAAAPVLSEKERAAIEKKRLNWMLHFNRGSLTTYIAQTSEQAECPDTEE
jgi:hypothetical protein